MFMDGNLFCILATILQKHGAQWFSLSCSIKYPRKKDPVIYWKKKMLEIKINVWSLQPRHTFHAIRWHWRINSFFFNQSQVEVVISIQDGCVRLLFLYTIKTIQDSLCINLSYYGWGHRGENASTARSN